MRIALGSDHAGYEGKDELYKPEIQKHLEQLGHVVIDCGTNGSESVDYPDFAAKVSNAIMAGEADRGVLLCGTGIGISIAANRFAGIRAATVANEDMARLSREHNDANVICVGRRISSLEECLRYIDIWLETEFSGGERHVRRVKKMK